MASKLNVRKLAFKLKQEPAIEWTPEFLEKVTDTFEQYDQLMEQYDKENPSEGMRSRWRARTRTFLARRLGMNRNAFVRLLPRYKSYATRELRSLARRCARQGVFGEEVLLHAPPWLRTAHRRGHTGGSLLVRETNPEDFLNTMLDALREAWAAAGDEGEGAKGDGGDEGDGEHMPPRSVLEEAARRCSVSVEGIRRLWRRLSALAWAKLQLVAAAGDVSYAVPPEGRMAPQDWAAADLLLTYSPSLKLVTEESLLMSEPLAALRRLARLAEAYALEPGNPRGWALAHQRYCRERGCSVSLVLLQRRWHQLKQQARQALRALALKRRLGLPEGDLPRVHQLHYEIAKRFPKVVLAPLPSWSSIVRAGGVYSAPAPMPLEGELPPPPPDRPDVDDVIVVERDIETIDLDSDEDLAEKAHIPTPRVGECPPVPSTLPADYQVPVLISPLVTPISQENSQPTDGWEKRCQIFVHPQEGSGPPGNSPNSEQAFYDSSGNFACKFKYDNCPGHSMQIKSTECYNQIIENENGEEMALLLPRAVTELTSGSTTGSEGLEIAALRKLDPSKVRTEIEFDDDDDFDPKLVVDDTAEEAKSDVITEGDRGGPSEATHEATNNKLLEDFINRTKDRENESINQTGERDRMTPEPGAVRVTETDKLAQYAQLVKQKICQEYEDGESAGRERDGDGAGGEEEEAIDPKLLMSTRVVLVRCDAPPLPPVPPVPPSPDPHLAGLSEEFLLKNRHLLRQCRRLSLRLARLRVRVVGLAGQTEVPWLPKRVRLPDIAEVRRQNRLLLTAQVAPINADAQGTASVTQPTAEEPEQEELTSMELNDLLRKIAGSVSEGPDRGKRPHCCLARKHRVVNDARRRLSARRQRPPPPDIRLHQAKHGSSGCSCCCVHLLVEEGPERLAADQRALRRDAQDLLRAHSRRIIPPKPKPKPEAESTDSAKTKKEKTPHKLPPSDSSTSANPPQQDARGHTDPQKPKQKSDIPLTPKGKRRKKPHKPDPIKSADPAKDDGYAEWIRQKNMLTKYFHINTTPTPTPTERPKPPPTVRLKPSPTDRPKPPLTEQTKPPPTDRPKLPPTERPKPPPTERLKPPPTEPSKHPPTDRPKPPPTERPKPPPPPPTDRPKPPPTDRPKPTPTERPKPPPTERPKPPPPPPPIGLEPRLVNNQVVLTSPFEPHRESNIVTLCRKKDQGEPGRLVIDLDAETDRQTVPSKQSSDTSKDSCATSQLAPCAGAPLAIPVVHTITNVTKGKSLLKKLQGNCDKTVKTQLDIVKLMWQGPTQKAPPTIVDTKCPTFTVTQEESPGQIVSRKRSAEVLTKDETQSESSQAKVRATGCPKPNITQTTVGQLQNELDKTLRKLIDGMSQPDNEPQPSLIESIRVISESGTDRIKPLINEILLETMERPQPAVIQAPPKLVQSKPIEPQPTMEQVLPADTHKLVQPEVIEPQPAVIQPPMVEPTEEPTEPRLVIDHQEVVQLDSILVQPNVEPGTEQTQPPVFVQQPIPPQNSANQKSIIEKQQSKSLVVNIQKHSSNATESSDTAPIVIKCKVRKAKPTKKGFSILKQNLLNVNPLTINESKPLMSQPHLVSKPPRERGVKIAPKIPTKFLLRCPKPPMAPGALAKGAPGPKGAGRPRAAPVGKAQAGSTPVQGSRKCEVVYPLQGAGSAEPLALPPAAPLPVGELLRGGDLKTTRLLRVDAARPPLRVANDYLVVTDLEVVFTRALYYTMAPQGLSRLLVFEEDPPSEGSPHSAPGRIQVKSFARLPTPHDTIFVDGKLYKKLSDEPVYMQALSALCDMRSVATMVSHGAPLALYSLPQGTLAPLVCENQYQRMPPLSQIAQPTTPMAQLTKVILPVKPSGQLAQVRRGEQSSSDDEVIVVD